MDNRDFFTIANFIWLLSKLWFIKPLCGLMVVNVIFIYVPTLMFTISSRSWLYLVVLFIMLTITFCAAYVFWKNATWKAKVFCEKTYTETTKVLEKTNYKYEKYLDFVSKTGKFVTYIWDKENVSGFIGIAVDWIILFVIYNPFRRMMI